MTGDNPVVELSRNVVGSDRRAWVSERAIISRASVEREAGVEVVSGGGGLVGAEARGLARRHAGGTRLTEDRTRTIGWTRSEGRRRRVVVNDTSLRVRTAR